MPSQKSFTKATALARVLALVAGIKLHLPSGSFSLGGSTFTSAALVQLLTDLANAMTATNVEQARVKDVLGAERAMKAKVDPVIRDFERLVLATFPGAVQTLADFGMAPPKAPAPRTVEQLAAAKAKAESTRKARGTVGSRKRLAIQGNVTGVVVTPVTAPAASPAQPAPNASPTPPPSPGGSATK